MRYIPHEYQEMAYRRILETKRIGLLMEMGLGKTVITLTAIDELMYTRFEVSRVLVIAPKRVAEDTWSRESEKWDHLTHLKISKMLGTAQQREAGMDADADIYVINRENVKWLVDRCRKNRHWPYDMVVIDELSSFKSNQSQRFKALKTVMPLVKRVVGLTGTPTPNGYMDLWSEIYLLDAGQRLGKTIGEYREKYFTPGMRNGYTVFSWNLRPGADRIIQEKISDICVSMKAEDYLRMPERIDNMVPVALSPEELEAYRQVEREKLLELNDEIVLGAPSAAAVAGKLLQMANGAVYRDDGNVVRIHERKLDALEEILDCNQGPVLVFYNFRHDLEALQERFRDLEPRTLDDGRDIEEWNDGKIRLLLAHPASIGHGLNIQAGGHIIVWYGLTWSLELYQQANARLYRQGQKHAVIIHHLIAKGTIDEAVMKALAGKDNVQTALMDAINERRRRIC